MGIICNTYYSYSNLIVLNILCTDAQCQNCGKKKIHYPLSTEEGCGDPDYRSFYCDYSTRELYFKSLNGDYKVSRINPDARTFVIKPEVTGTCLKTNSPSHDGDIHLNYSKPFFITNKNTILLFGCTTPQPVSLNCNSSPCYDYMGDEPTSCPESTKCCSYTSGGVPSTMYSVGVLNTNCSTYTSIADVNVGWEIELEIGWRPFQEPACKSMKDCELWLFTKCRMPYGSVDMKKRCFCDAKLQWDKSMGKCIAESESGK